MRRAFAAVRRIGRVDLNGFDRAVHHVHSVVIRGSGSVMLLHVAASLLHCEHSTQRQHRHHENDNPGKRIACNPVHIEIIVPGVPTGKRVVMRIVDSVSYTCIDSPQSSILVQQACAPRSADTLGSTLLIP